MGDVNECIPLRFPFRRNMRFLSRWGHRGAFQGSGPRLARDCILVDPHQQLIKTHVHKSRLAQVASDHYPVATTIAQGL